MSVELQATVAVDLSGLTEFRVAIEAQLNHQQTGPITKAYNQWVARYRSFIKERFDKYSRGGGDWEPLSDKTKARRRKPKPKRKPRNRKIAVDNKTGKAKVKTGRPSGRKGSKKQETYWNRGKRKKQLAKMREQVAKAKKFEGRKFSILRDTGTLFAAVSPTVADKPGAVSAAIPFGMRVGYGGASRHPKAKATIADIAAFHQTGAGYLPKREIIVRPDAETGAAMTRYMMKAIAELTKGGDEQVSQQ